MSKIIYTYTDEAPALATFSFYPMIKEFFKRADVEMDIYDISLAGRVLANFSDYLDESQRVKDYLSILGNLTEEKEANIVKLPNISASLPQLNACIKELREKGFNVPLYPSEPKNEEETKIKERYAKVLGSAVNPVLRQGNSIRTASKAVKEYAKAYPHNNGVWNKDVKTEVFYMDGGDFYENEKSKIFDKNTSLKVEFIRKDGSKKTLKENLEILENEVVDATFMSAKKLDETIDKSIEHAKEKGLLYSVHLKATMMKVSDPVMFGHFVKRFYSDVFSEFGSELEKAGVNPNNGLKDLFTRIEKLECRDKILAKFDEIYTLRPDIAMVDSDKGITNLHVPSDVIIDNSMPSMIRNSGKMWDKDGKLQECLAVIPDRSYATTYESMINELKENGTLNPATIGSVTNVGLMAKKAEEYGSHDKTFIMEADGKVVVSDSEGEICFEFDVENGDIFRMTQAKDDAIKNWIKIGIELARERDEKAIFWLDEKRAHDASLIKIIKDELKNYDLNGLDISILAPQDALLETNKTIRAGKNCISITGNVLRDYLTDLYPILELGTSAKMLSIVPLLNGGGMFETGAGGSAPKHVEQLVNENHLRWDSLGEFMALVESLKHYSKATGNKNAKTLASSLDAAISKFLKNDKSPKRRVGEPDNRNSHFYLMLYFAEELSKTELGDRYEDLAVNLKNNEEKINAELLKVQGVNVNLGGYYKVDANKVEEIMRPSKTLNSIIG
ncbi:MAG: NADP-dependent isocitrate dehydrogenase [Campylobacteraceae bacterium]|nr:NADP-dependent isocitrate dehydrogenase [Campylobacteraceae bacterium]